MSKCETLRELGTHSQWFVAGWNWVVMNDVVQEPLSASYTLYWTGERARDKMKLEGKILLSDYIIQMMRDSDMANYINTIITSALRDYAHCNCKHFEDAYFSGVIPCEKHL